MVVNSSSWPPRLRNTDLTACEVQIDSSQVGSETAPSTMERRVLSRAGGKEDERRDEEEVGRTRDVSAEVVERIRGMSSRPMLPEAEVMRIDLGGMVALLFSFF